MKTDCTMYDERSRSQDPYDPQEKDLARILLRVYRHTHTRNYAHALLRD